MLSKHFRDQFVILLISILSVGIFALFQGQDINLDLLNYHYYNGYAFIYHRYHQDVMPAMMQTYMNPYLDVLNYYFIAIDKPRVTSFLLSLFTGFSCFFLYKIADALFSSMSEYKFYNVLASVLIGITGAGSISLLSTTTNDTKVGLLVMIALYFLMCSLSTANNKRIKYIILAAIISGFGAGLKLPFLAYTLGLFMAFLWSSPMNKRHVYECGLFVLFSLAGFSVANAYWMYFVYHLFDNPFYPFYNNIFHSPYAPFISFNLDAGTLKHDFIHYLLLPFNLAIKENTLISERIMRDARFAIVVTLSLVYFLKPKAVINHSVQTEKLWPFFFIFFAASYCIWLLSFAVYRYALPLELSSGIVIIYLTQKILNSPKKRILLIISIFILLATTTVSPNWGRTHFDKKYFSMQVPIIPPKSIILFTTRSLSYTIPFFPSETQFIGMPFLNLGEEPGNLNQKHSLILLETMNKIANQAPEPSIFTLTNQDPDNNDKRSISTLNKFGYHRNQSKCFKFTTNIGDVLSLCLVSKK